MQTIQVRIPDSQTVMLAALVKEVDRLFDAKVIDADDMQYYHEGEPESVVFFGEDLDHDFVDADEAMDTIRLVGERDLQAKIDYWTSVLKDIREAQAEEE